MKTIKSFLPTLLFLVFSCICIAAEAQRGRSNNRYDRGRNYRQPVYYPRNYNRGNVYIRPSLIPRGRISLSFGGNPYYYHGGNFYRPYGSSVSIVIPPIGIRIGSLPYGYRRVYVGPDLFYFYNGTYYRQYDDRQYTVVEAPIGAELSSLPPGSKSVIVNGEKFYELNGTYYKEQVGNNGSLRYTVVGKHGEIDNTDPAFVDNANPVISIGDIVSDLPEGCKTVVINGQKLFVSPDDVYYSEEVSGKVVHYKVVGTVN